MRSISRFVLIFFFQEEEGKRERKGTGVQRGDLPIGGGSVPKTCFFAKNKKKKNEK